MSSWAHDRENGMVKFQGGLELFEESLAGPTAPAKLSEQVYSSPCSSTATETMQNHVCKGDLDHEDSPRFVWAVAHRSSWTRHCRLQNFTGISAYGPEQVSQDGHRRDCSNQNF
eukprot:4746840-Amphidinium_carterae.1